LRAAVSAAETCGMRWPLDAASADRTQGQCIALPFLFLDAVCRPLRTQVNATPVGASMRPNPRPHDPPTYNRTMSISAVVSPVTELVAELAAGGYLEKSREGRRNRYRVIMTEPLRHPVEGSYTIGDLLRAIAGSHARD